MAKIIYGILSIILIITVSAYVNNFVPWWITYIIFTVLVLLLRFGDAFLVYEKRHFNLALFAVTALVLICYYQNPVYFSRNIPEGSWLVNEEQRDNAFRIVFKDVNFDLVEQLAGHREREWRLELSGYGQQVITFKSDLTLHYRLFDYKGKLSEEFTDQYRIIGDKLLIRDRKYTIVEINRAIGRMILKPEGERVVDSGDREKSVLNSNHTWFVNR